MRRGRGYLAAALGCVIGGVALLAAGIVLGAWLAASDGLEGLAWPFFGAFIGVAVGAGGGAWLTLTVRRYHGATGTGLLVGGVAPIIATIASLASESLAPRRDDTSLELWIAAAIFTVLAGAAAVGARVLVVRGRGSDWDVLPDR